MGPIEPQGPKGDHGDPGTVPSGTLVFLFADDPVPAGYTFVGSYDQKFNEAIGASASRFVTIRVYRKN